MGTWKTRGLRGSVLEDALNLTNDKYREMGLGLVQKIPTPITPIEIDKEKHHITLAYFEKKSTVDYIGVIQGMPVCFDAKECNQDVFRLQNIHEHQIAFMEDFEKQEGIAFLILYFSHRDIYYYLTFEKMMEFVERSKNNGRKSFRIEELDPEWQIEKKKQMFIHYLEKVGKDLEIRNEKKEKN